jgi:hypothetical protein
MNGKSKLRAAPVPVKIFLEYEDMTPGEKDLEKKKWEPKAGSEIEAWIHPLSDDEAFDIEAVGMEAFRTFKARGAEIPDAEWKSSRVSQAQQVFYCVKISEKEGAERLFKSEGEIIDLPYAEVLKIMKVYGENFIVTKEELKNSLRARIGNGFKTESSLPSTSKMEA